MNLQQLPSTPSFDPNPLTHPNGLDLTGLPPYVAEQLENLYYQLYQQQGNNEAGDATTSWYETTQVTDSPLHQVGAIGRFVHPTYGVILARYVQFTKCVAGLWTGSPVGYCDGPGGFIWKATNDYTKSHTSGLIGVMGSFTPPGEGQYGWVISDGVNTQTLQFVGNVAPSAGDLISWTETGFAAEALLNGAAILGRVSSVDGITNRYGNVWELPPASVHITPSR